MRSGSIDNRYASDAKAGMRIHKALQKAGGSRYQSEVYLKDTVVCDGVEYQLDGRADGVIKPETQDGLYTIDEIKSIGGPIERVTEDYNTAHWGQAGCYGYLYAKKEGLTAINLQLTYVQPDTEEARRFVRRAEAADLEAQLLDILRRYRVWADWQLEWASARNESLQALKFPFPAFREGQRKLAGAVYQTISLAPSFKERRALENAALKASLAETLSDADIVTETAVPRPRLFCQAPTGIGKTISTLFPAVKALGEGKCQRIFYLTAKTIARKAAEEAAFRLREKGMRLKTITLTAKDKVCFQRERDCNPEACVYAEGYYDRVNDAMLELLAEHDHFTRPILEECGRKHRLCPFELALDLTLWCDCVICDYNYLFDPMVSLQRFFGDGGGEYVFLVDEVHNLVDRARDMYSAPLKRSTIVRTAESVTHKGLKSALERALEGLKELGRAILSDEGYDPETFKGDVLRSFPEPPLENFQCLKVLTFYMEGWMEEHKSSEERGLALDLYFELKFFWRILEDYNQGYVTLMSFSPKEITVELLCLDPKEQLDRCLGQGRAAILFSATLSPPSYYASLLGGEEKAVLCDLESPFPKEHCAVLGATNISTKYVNRTASLTPIARMLGELAGAKPGNYMAFFPSYSYMEQVYNTFIQIFPEINADLQSGRMTESEKEDFLERFSVPEESSKESYMAFCVLGGSFSEGVDLKGERLIGAAVIGVGLPQIGPRQDLIKEHFNQKNGQGFDYAYKFPGINKVLQGGGRVIRGMSDRGVVLLIDDRFWQKEYRSLLPAHWRHMSPVDSPEGLKSALQEFWQKMDE